MTRRNRLSSSFWNKLLVLSLISVPILPKIKVLSLGPAPILLDDFALIFGTGSVLISVLWSASIHGRYDFKLSYASGGFVLLLAYKIVSLPLLALTLPIIDHVGYVGGGVFLNEGLFLIGKLCALGCVYYIFYNIINTEVDLLFVVRYQLLCVAIVIIIGILQILILNHNVISSTFRNIHSIKTNYHVFFISDPWFAETAVGHEHFGAYLVLSIPLVMSMLIYRWPLGRWSRSALLVLLAGCLFCIVFASSRGAWIGFIFMLSAFLIIMIKTGKFYYFFRIALPLIIVIICLEFWAYTHFWGYIEKRIVLLYTVFDDQILDDSAKHRLHAIEFFANKIYEHPLVGMGAGSAGRIAEGQYIRELVEGGIIGFGMFWVLVYKCSETISPFFKVTGYNLERAINLGLFCGLVGLLGQCLFTELFVLTKIGVPFWIWAAVAHRAVALRFGSIRN